MSLEIKPIFITNLKRCVGFRGWTAIHKDGEPKIALQDFPRDAYKGNRNVLIHDQGGSFKLNEKYSIQLANLKYSETLEVMTLKVIDNTNGKNYLLFPGQIHGQNGSE